MIGILALLTRIFSNPYSNVIQKRLGQKGFKSLWISFFAYFILSLFCIIPSFFTDWARFDFVFWQNVLLAGIVGAFGNWFLVEALKCGELSVLGPINSYKSIVSVIFAFLLLGEIPAILQFLGIFLIIFGSYFIFDGSGEKISPKIFLRRDIKFRLLALVFTALEAVFIKKIILMSDILTSFILWCFFSAIFSFVILVFLKSKIALNFYISTKRNLKDFLTLCLCMFLMQFSTNIVFEKMNVSCALALFQLSSLLSVFFGWRYFSEKNLKRKILGTIIMILGSIVVILF